MPFPYERHIKGLTVPAGKSSYGFLIDFPYAGYIKRFGIKQSGGTNVGFTVNLYSARVVETDEGPPTNTIPKELVRIIPEQTGSAGAAVTVVTDNHGYAYMNREKPSQAPGEVARGVYLEIAHTAQGADTLWDVVIVATAVDK